MTKEFNGNQIHGICKLFVFVLRLIELGRGGEAIDEDQGRLRGIVDMRHLVCGIDATKVRDTDSLCVRHCSCCNS